MFGPFRVAVGGKTPGYDASQSPAKSKLAMETCFYHERSLSLWEEVIHGYNVGAILDCSVSSGTLAFLAAVQRIPYFGVALTKEHVDRVKDRVTQMIMEEFMKGNSPVYNAKFANVISSANQASAENATGGASGAVRGASSAAAGASRATGGTAPSGAEGLGEMEAGQG